LLVENENNTDATIAKPLMVWFNGGPGCSSMLAFMQENGPIILEDGDTAPIRNTFPWSANASVLYIESPAGVGFSKVEPPTQLTYSDMSTAEDAFAALEQWYLRFPEYGPEGNNNELFIAGESYGGIYAPYLAW
jgi:serine carboxypeptidase-like clade 2